MSKFTQRKIDRGVYRIYTQKKGSGKRDYAQIIVKSKPLSQQTLKFNIREILNSPLYILQIQNLYSLSYCISRCLASLAS